MGIKFTNNAIGTLASGITAGDLTIILTATHGARFPSLSAGDYFYARLLKDTNENEIIKVTARSTDTITAARGQDGTSALDFAAGDEIRITWPRASIEAVRDEARQPAAVENITTSVSLTSADKLKQKVITATATVTLPAASDLAVGEWIDFKSATTGLVKITAAGADTLDGDAPPAYYRLPSFCTCRAMKTGATTFHLTMRPDVEVGDVVWWPVATVTPKKGFVFADNVTISRTDFAGLFDVYGTTHGAGNGTTTFGKVDMRGRIPVGRDDMGGAAASRVTTGGSGIDGTAVGSSGGAQTVTISTGELPASGLSVPGLSVPGLSVPSLSVPSLSVPSLSVSGTCSATGTSVAYPGGGSSTGPALGVEDRQTGSPSTENSSVSVSGSISGSTGTGNTGTGNTGTGTTGGGTTGGGTTGNMGSGNALNKMPPAMVGNWLVKT